MITIRVPYSNHLLWTETSSGPAISPSFEEWLIMHNGWTDGVWFGRYGRDRQGVDISFEDRITAMLFKLVFF